METFDDKNEMIRMSKLRFESKKYDREFLDDVYDDIISSHGIITIPVRYQENIEKILEYVAGRKDMVTFVVTFNEEKYVVFRYKPVLSEKKDIKEKIAQANEAFTANHFTKSFKLYLELLSVFARPSSFMYSRAGLSLLRTGKKQKAVDYLLIATVMAKKEGKSMDYTSLVENLKLIGDGADKKETFVMDESEFQQETEEYYEFSEFDAVNDYVLLNNTDVETACRALGLDAEKTDIVNLLYAKEFFLKKEAKKGEKFVKVYEGSEHKTTTSKNLYHEIMNNKKRYLNDKSSTNTKQLLLTMQPRGKK